MTAPHILTVSPTGTATLTCPHDPPACRSDHLDDVVSCFDLDPGAYQVWPVAGGARFIIGGAPPADGAP